MRNPFGNIAAPPQGYIWDFAQARQRVVSQLRRVRARGTRAAARWRRPCRASKGTSIRRIRRSISAIPDSKRIDVWLEEFKQFDAERHSCRSCRSSASATITPAARRRRADAARDGRRERSRARPARRGDLAQRVLEGIGDLRRSKTTRRTGRITWTRTGRSCSRSARSSRRGVVDSTLYTTSGVLRTMELILGLPPMSQYDAAATPMYNAFQHDADR